MAKGNTKIIYDDEEDILLLSKDRKVQASIDIGDFIIDVDTNGFVSGMEILNASDNIKISREQLKDLQKASMSITYKPNYVYIYLVITLRDREKDITIPLTLDLGHMAVQTEVTNFAVA